MGLGARRKNLSEVSINNYIFMRFIVKYRIYIKYSLCKHIIDKKKKLIRSQLKGKVTYS